MTDQLTPAQSEEFEERAGIIQHMGNLPKEQAESDAMRLIQAKIHKFTGHAPDE